MGAQSIHYLFGPSAMQRRMACIGSAAMEQGLPDTSSEYADDGTASHELLELTLKHDQHRAHAFLGRYIKVGDRSFRVDNDRADHVQHCVDWIDGRVDAYKLAGAVSVTVHCEIDVPIARITGEANATGRADVIIVAEFADGHVEYTVYDLKYGRGVRVTAERNEQGMMYALGAIELYSVLYGEPTHVEIVIHQPRVQREPDTWTVPLAELQEFASNVRAAVRAAYGCIDSKANGLPLDQWLTPGVKQCQFCKAKAIGPDGAAICPGIAQVFEDVVADFPTIETAIQAEDIVQMGEGTPVEDEVLAVLKPANKSLPNLSRAMKMVDLVEDWCKAVRAETERRMLAGEAVEEFKLVQGRAGNRAWKDAEQAEQTLKSMRVKEDQMYDFKLISPTTAEKLSKDKTLGPRQWTKLQELIHRPDGAISVAHVSDKREEYKPVPLLDAADDFDAAPNDPAADSGDDLC